MIEVNAFLTAEGNSDYDFLPVLLERALNRLCLPHRLAVAGMTLLFYHYDGSAAPDREERKYWAPLRESWKKHGPGRPLVRVVPVREMESRALSDLDVLRQVAGSSWHAKGVFEGERLSRVECLSDPKRTLKEVVASGRRRRRAGREAGDYLTRIAELMSLDYLESVPSYRLWLSGTCEALEELRLIRD
ncbi:hypothetical protein [Nonomuraea sp. NPDC050783]|uniref:hypothetical protein n=1 Tax=Nonomuraea sp. NPDC050783 TaxID=3154634 RepID=UPI003466889F